MTPAGRSAREGFRVIEPQDGIKILPTLAGAPGVDTLEGRIGPLLNAVRGGCHYIEVPPGAFLEDHPHPSESLIYTLRGEWVLCSRGERWHMRTGSLFWFGDGIPTGYENPFAEPAYLLIFKTEPRTPGHDAGRLDHIEGIRRKLEEEHAAGTPFSFHELPEDHPARTFARGLGAPHA